MFYIFSEKGGKSYKNDLDNSQKNSHILQEELYCDNIVYSSLMVFNSFYFFGHNFRFTTHGYITLFRRVSVDNDLGFHVLCLMFYFCFCQQYTVYGSVARNFKRGCFSNLIDKIIRISKKYI